MNENENKQKSPLEDEPQDDFIIGQGFVVDESLIQDEEPSQLDDESSLQEDENPPQNDENQDYNQQPRKGKNIVKNVIWIIAIFVVSIGLAVSLIYVGADYLGIGFGRGGECIVEIEPGSSTSKIAEQLKEVGVVKCPLVFRVYSKLKKYDAKYKFGVYTFNSDCGYESLAEMLIKDGAKAQTVSGVKIPEMATIDDIAKILDESGVCKKDDFIYEVRNGKFDYDFIKNIPTDSVYYRLEGYLYPETYEFYAFDSEKCAHLAIDKMLSTFEERIAGDLRKQLDSDSDYDFHNLITIASLVESEAGIANDEDRSKVARVFFNRLEGVNWQGPKFLQTDPSTKYPHGKGRYNTYKTEGLPPGPIGSPSLRSIKAAVNPTPDFDMTYFVTDKNGKFYFNNTLNAHNKIIAELKAKGLWIYTTLG